MKLMHALTGKTPDWIVSAEFLGSMLEKWNKVDLKKKYDEIVEAVLRDILISTDRDLQSEEESDEKRYLKATEGLDSDGWHSARLLAEIVVDRVYDQNDTKPPTFKKMSEKYLINLTNY